MHVISLGSNCYCKSALDRAGYPGDPMPFDWLSTTLPMVQNCIEDGFAKLRDTQYFEERIREGKVQVKHTGYQNHWDTTFTHYDPRNGMGAEYLQRSIDRWNDMMASDEPKAFIFVASIFPFEVERYRPLVASLAAAISERTSSAATTGITTCPVADGQNQIGEPEIIGGMFVHYTSQSRMRGIRFEDEADDAAVSRIIRRLVGDTR